MNSNIDNNGIEKALCRLSKKPILTANHNPANWIRGSQSIEDCNLHTQWQRLDT